MLSLCLNYKDEKNTNFFLWEGDIVVTTSKGLRLNILVTKFYKFMGIEFSPCYYLWHLFPVVLGSFFVFQVAILLKGTSTLLNKSL